MTDGRFTDAMAVDGVVSADSRWSAAKTDEQWLQVDLGSVKTVSEVIVRFHAEALAWDLQVSEDGSTWEKIHEVTDGKDGGVKEDVQVSFDARPVRYIKYAQHKMWNHASNGKQYSTSIYELEAYEKIDIQGLEISGFQDAIGVGDSFDIGLTVTPAEAAHKAVTYASSNEKVATVSDEGKVAGVGEGTATITVAAKDNPEVKVEREVRVIDGFALAFEKSELSLSTRDKRFLEYRAIGALPEKTEVSYASDNEAVAKVDSKTGLLTVTGEGEATITLLADGKVQDSLSLTVSAPAYDPDYDIMMDRWLTRTTGGADLDLTDNDIIAYVAKISAEGEELWDQLDTSEDRDRLWPKVASDTTSADYTTQFTKIKKLALAFRVEGSTLYQNPELLSDIVNAVNFMVTEKKYNGSYTTGNWWDWQIGCTQPLCDILMIVSDYTDYSSIEPAVKAIEGYAKEPGKRFNGYTETGANRTDTGLAVLGSAIVGHNDTRMQMVTDQVPEVMDYVTSGDGMYADGSVVQHTKVAYTGAYGNELVKGIGRISSIIAGTRWDFVGSNIENVYHTILEGYIPLMHQGQQMAMVSGRSVTRAPFLNNFSTEFLTGSETISNIMLIAQFAPEEYAAQFKSAVKGWMTDSQAWIGEQGEDFYYDFYTNARDFDALLQVKEVMGDEAVDASTWTGMKVYGSMDRVVQAAEGYQAGLSMYSKRIYNYEAAVGSGVENAHGWHTGSGMLYVYNGDLAQYDVGYWPTVDPYRMPGTTVDTRELADTADQSKASPQSWAGGATDGVNGAAGMYYNANGMSGMDTQAKKSWFFLPGQIVALGTDIHGTTDATIETTVENRMIGGDANVTTVNGEAFEGDHTESMKLADGSYAHLTGTGADSDMGYYFIEGGDVDVTRETRTGTYADINGVFPSDDVYTKSYFKMGYNHGTGSVSDASYGYVLLPGASEDETASYAADPKVQVLQNDAKAQAVMDAQNGIFAMNTWPEESVTVGGFTVDNSASVYAQNKDGKLAIAVSNPKQNDVDLTLKLGFAYDGVASLDEGVTRNADGSFTFSTKGKAGASQVIVLNVGDKTALVEAIEQARALDEGAYTPESWSALAERVEAGEEVLDAFAPGQDAIDAAVKDIQDAIASLVKVPEPEPETFTVTFDDLLGSTQNVAVTVKAGETVDPSLVPDPVCEGWRFDGWFVDADRTIAFDFGMAITSDMTVYAKWTKVGEPGGENPDGGEPGGEGSTTPTPKPKPDGTLVQTGDASTVAIGVLAISAAALVAGGVVLERRKR